MKKLIFYLCAGLLAGGFGCLGSDPNENSQCYLAPCQGDAGPSPTGTAGSGGPGTGGTGGSGSTGNGPIVGMPLATFDTGLEGFVFGTYDEKANLNGASSPTKGTLSFDDAMGSPNPGSMKAVAPYSGANQYIDVQKQFGTGNPQNWSGQTIHVRIRASDGTFKGGAQVYAITTSGFIFGGKFTNFGQNSSWQEFTMDVDHPSNGDGANASSGYDPTKVVVFGVQLNTGSSGAGAGPVTFNIDSFSLSPGLTTTGTGGTGGAGGGGAGGTTGAGGHGGTTGSGSTTGAAGSGDASVGN
jgi:hypothetical protein